MQQDAAVIFYSIHYVYFGGYLKYMYIQQQIQAFLIKVLISLLRYTHTHTHYKKCRIFDSINIIIVKLFIYDYT